MSLRMIQSSDYTIHVALLHHLCRLRSKQTEWGCDAYTHSYFISQTRQFQLNSQLVYVCIHGIISLNSQQQQQIIGCRQWNSCHCTTISDAVSVDAEIVSATHIVCAGFLYTSQDFPCL